MVPRRAVAGTPCFSATAMYIASSTEAGALVDVSHMPARVKCAVLGWHTMEEMLDKKNEK